MRLFRAAAAAAAAAATAAALDGNDSGDVGLVEEGSCSSSALPPPDEVAASAEARLCEEVRIARGELMVLLVVRNHVLERSWQGAFKAEPFFEARRASERKS